MYTYIEPRDMLNLSLEDNTLTLDYQNISYLKNCTQSSKLGMVTKLSLNQTFNITSSVLRKFLILITNKTQISDSKDILMNGASTQKPLKVTDVTIET